MSVGHAAPSRTRRNEKLNCRDEEARGGSRASGRTAESDRDRFLRFASFLVVLVNTTSIHQARSEQRQGGGQLGIELHQLRNPACRHRGVMKVVEDWVQHGDLGDPIGGL